MIVSTTPSMEGKSIREYHEIVIGHGTTRQYKPEKAQEAVRVAIGQMKSKRGILWPMLWWACTFSGNIQAEFQSPVPL